MIQSFYWPDNTLILIQWILFVLETPHPTFLQNKQSKLYNIHVYSRQWIYKQKQMIIVYCGFLSLCHLTSTTHYVASPNDNRPQRHHTCAASFSENQKRWISRYFVSPGKYLHMMKLTLLEASWEQAHRSQFKPSIHWTLILYNGRMINWLLFIFW